MTNGFKNSDEEEEEGQGSGGVKPGKQTHLTEDSDQTGEGSQGSTTEVRFRYQDAMSIAPRDDALPPSEIRRLLLIQKDQHKRLVDKQRLLRKDRKAAKEGRLTQQQIAGRQLGAGGGSYSKYKQHPITQKAQFSGMDPQVNLIPSENKADTNEELRNDLENRYLHRLRNTPKFNPKPRPY